MESAIAQHLRCPRMLSRRVADDYTPPYEAYSGRLSPSVTEVVMGYLGVQSRGDAARPRALEALRALADQLGLEHGAVHHELTEYRDEAGYDNFIIVAYWNRAAVFEQWLSSPAVADWWQSDGRLDEGLGYFREIAIPRAEQLETLYAFRGELPGVGAMAQHISEPIQEHGYWGAMRDRVPASQSDRMTPSGKLSRRPSHGVRVSIAGHDNLCLIRSGQDWSDCDPEERALYLEQMEPTLRSGMDFLRDQGREVGCYSNRYVQLIGRDGTRLDKSFVVGHWHSMERLERWAESHPSHLRIFVTFMGVVANFQKLRLYHEVSVCAAAGQRYDYINCHPATGLMRDAAG